MWERYCRETWRTFKNFLSVLIGRRKECLSGSPVQNRTANNTYKTDKHPVLWNKLSHRPCRYRSEGFLASCTFCLLFRIPELCTTINVITLHQPAFHQGLLILLPERDEIWIQIFVPGYHGL